MRILWRIALSLVALSLLAQSPGGLPDIMGTGSVAQVASSGSAISITFIAPSSNTSHVRVGGPGISTTNGIDIAPGGTWYYQALPTGQQATPFARYQLAAQYYLVQSGDKLTITWVL